MAGQEWEKGSADELQFHDARLPWPVPANPGPMPTSAKRVWGVVSTAPNPELTALSSLHPTRSVSPVEQRCQSISLHIRSQRRWHALFATYLSSHLEPMPPEYST